jgi:hypothetical protein
LPSVTSDSLANTLTVVASVHVAADVDVLIKVRTSLPFPAEDRPVAPRTREGEVRFVVKDPN